METIPDYMISIDVLVITDAMVGILDQNGLPNLSSNHLDHVSLPGQGPLVRNTVSEHVLGETPLDTTRRTDRLGRRAHPWLRQGRSATCIRDGCSHHGYRYHEDIIIPDIADSE